MTNTHTTTIETFSKASISTGTGMRTMFVCVCSCGFRSGRKAEPKFAEAVAAKHKAEAVVS